MDKTTIKIYLYSQTAEPGPPLGTVLGNLGLNTVKFCKEFNEFTKDLPNYFKLAVIIEIFENKSYNFSVGLPSTGFIISQLKDDDFCVNFEDLCKLAILKFPNLPLDKSFKIILGSVHSSGLVILFS